MGYHQKVTPPLSDIDRPLISLTSKDVWFDWTEQCQNAFMLLKKNLMEKPVLQYSDPKEDGCAVYWFQ